MGIIKFFKNIFKKTIDLRDIDKSQVVALNGSNAKIKFGTKLNVPENFVCILVYKNKIADIFQAGQYKLDIPTMPILSRIEKLTKPNKKGDLPKDFHADIYYVNLGQIENVTFSNAQIFLKDKGYKNLSVKMSGIFSFQVIDPEEFMDAMFTQYGVLRNQVVKDELSYWISKLVSRKVKKNSPTVLELYARESSCFDGLIDYINKDVFDCGVKLSKIEITDVKFPKKVYKKVTLSYDESHEQMPTQYVQEGNVLPDTVESVEKQKFEEQSNVASLEEPTQSGFKSNGNITAISTEKEETSDEAFEIQDEELLQKVLSQMEAEQTSADHNSPDDNSPIEKTLEYKSCPNCGSLNAKDSKICFLCKSKL